MTIIAFGDQHELSAHSRVQRLAYRFVFPRQAVEQQVLAARATTDFPLVLAYRGCSIRQALKKLHRKFSMIGVKPSFQRTALLRTMVPSTSKNTLCSPGATGE